MTSPDNKLSLLLTGGMNERTFPELVGPIVTQGTAPVLVESLNTRHGIIPGTCVRSPKFTNINPGITSPFGSVGQDCHGIIPCATGKSTAFLFRRGVGGAYAMGDAGNTTFNGPLRSVSDKLKAQHCYVPARISDAGAIPAASASFPISTSYNAVTDTFWFAYTSINRTLGTSLDVYITAFRGDGVLVAPPLLALTLAAASNGWVGLTSHGANGDRLYCADGGFVQMRTISVVGNVAAVTGGYSLMANAGVPDVCAIDDNTAALLAPRPGTPNDAQLMRIDVATNTVVATSVFTNYLKGTGWLAVTSELVNGTRYVAIACVSFDDTKTYVDVLVASTFIAARPTIITSQRGSVAVQFFRSSVTGNRVVFAISQGVNGSFTGGTSSIGTTVYSADPLSGSAANTVATVPWSMLANRGARYRSSSSELYPVFFLQRAYATGTSGDNPLSPDFVDDPALDGWMVGSDSDFTPIARIGCVRGATLSPARTAYEPYLPSAGCCEFTAGKMLVAYRKDNFQASASASAAYVGRYVVIDLTAHQPPIAHDKDGVALVASAMPVQWDGAELVEIGGPLHSPHIAVAATGGSGEVLAAGAYSYRAVYQWTDAAGLLHRSRPSAPVTVTMSGTDKASIRVTKPDTMRNGVSQLPIDVLIYATLVNLAEYHLMPAILTSSTAFEYKYDFVTSITTAQPQLYSGGTNAEEVVPTPPPPLHDIAIIGSRAWGIDAELRSRLVYSKYRVAGTGFEWAPAYELAFPSGAGKLVAVREWLGQVVVLAERAVFTVSGDGPSNQIGDRGSFSTPVKASDIGCSNTDSVIVTPVGIFWQDGDRLIQMSLGGDVQPVPEVRLPDPIVGTLLLRNQREVLFFSSAVAEIRALSYDQPLRWSKWDSQTLPVYAQNVALLPYDTNAALVYAATNGMPYRLDATSVGTATSMQWTTDWIVLDGDFQTSIIVAWVIFNGFVAGPHGLALDIFEDYEATPSTPKTWSAAQLAAIADAGGRYTVRFEPTKQRARAIKLRFRDDITGQAGSAGVRPRSVTAVFRVDDQLHEVAFVQGATQ